MLIGGVIQIAITWSKKKEPIQDSMSSNDAGSTNSIKVVITIFYNKGVIH